MRTTLGTLINWFDWLNRFLAVIAGILLVLITVAVCVEIISRSFFDISNPWLVELSEITLLYMTFLAAAWVLGKDGHVTLDLLLERISPGKAKVLHVVLSVIAAATCFIICYFGVFAVIDQYVNDIREPTIMGPRTFWITAIVPFGLLLLGIQFLRRGARAVQGLALNIDTDRN